MSQDFIDQDMIVEFVTEAREHLETIEPNLLELEQSPENLKLLNDIFRPMHSLKGASGFLGLQRMNKLAHKAENILDELRKGTFLVNSVIMDTILAATDALTSMLNNLESTLSEGEVATEHILEQMDRIMQGDMESHAADSPIPSIEVQNVSSEVQNVSSEDQNVSPEDQNVSPEDRFMDMNLMDSDSISQDKPNKIVINSTKEWINTLTKKSTYPLIISNKLQIQNFIEEAREIVFVLNDTLLNLEKENSPSDEILNNLFRFFHNLKGNSGLVGYLDLNALTHEAETLLNLTREGKIKITHTLVDLLLVVVDVIEALIDRVDLDSTTVSPFDTNELLDQLKLAVAGEGIGLPPTLQPSKQVSAPANVTVDSAIQEFEQIVAKQKAIITEALASLCQDSSQKDQQEALYNGVIAIENISKKLEFSEVALYAEVTAGTINHARNTNVDFSYMTDLLGQEVEIIYELAEKVIPAPIQVVSTPNLDIIPPSSPATAIQSTKSTESIPAKPVVNTKAMEPASPTAPVVAKKPEKDDRKVSSSIRVDYEKLDLLMNLIGELLINRNRYAMITKSLEMAGPDLDIHSVAQDLAVTTDSMARVSDELQNTLMKVRMLPVSSVFSRFPRLVRDISRKSGKDVDLVLEGEETELDKTIVEVIADPLMHLIRNSLDHGLELPEERIAAGKDPKGKVTLRAFHKGNSVIIEVEDDGKGIDPEKMREVAIRRGILTPEEARAMDDKDATELIFAPGFSSAETVTDISGRGVGMDVVRTNIKTLKGSVSTSSVLGKGTRFTLSLPLTLAIIEALMIKMGNQVYAIPLDAVSTTTKLEKERLTEVKGRKVVTIRGEVFGIVELAELLDLKKEHTEEPEILSVVILQDNERKLGLVVDGLMDRQEIVIKSLGAYMSDVRCLSGASIMGDGSVVLIIDPYEIHNLASVKT